MWNLISWKQSDLDLHSFLKILIVCSDYVPVKNFQSCQEGSFWVEKQVLSFSKGNEFLPRPVHIVFIKINTVFKCFAFKEHLCITLCR